MSRYLLLLVSLCCLAAGPASAHKASDAYLTLSAHGESLEGRLDVALRDLDIALDLDADGDGAISWGEVRVREREIAAYVFARVTVKAGDAACPLAARPLTIDRHSDGTYAVIAFNGQCEAASPVLTLDYRVLHDLDRQHRGLVRFVAGATETSVALTADAPRATLAAGGSGVAQFTGYLREGVRHIWSGFDHILFLVSLLLPAVLVRKGGQWTPAPSFRGAFTDVVKVVTAFTIAHSITLTLAASGLVALPPRLVESAIALSVALAALNNLFPVVGNARWAVAFGFGLIHGFGFANSLADLGLPAGSLALSLAGFNAGVELGQLAIVAGFLPIAFAMRASWSYRRVFVAGGSVAIVGMASVWLVGRALDIPGLAAFATG